MIIPIRCFTCGKVIASAYEAYKKRVELEGPEKAKDILDNLGISRYCCRRMIISHADLIDDVMPYT